MKESYPVELAEYARARGISNEPAFTWLVPHTLRKRDVILANLSTRIRKTTHKYGVEIPRDVKHAEEIDRANSNHFWRDAIRTKMLNVGVVFDVLPEDKKVSPGWHKVTGYIVFNVKMDST